MEVNKDDVYILIPAYNESKVIGDTILSIKKCGYNKIVVVDDASTDNTSEIVSEIKDVVLLKQVKNKGAGAATKAGFDYLKKVKAEYCVTIDADGQHDPNDIDKLIGEIVNYDVVIGSRLINPKGMPFKRLLFNKIGSALTFILYGVYVKDSQSGFKAFNKKAINNIKITVERFEFCSEIIYELKLRKLSYKEVPIRVIYTKYSLSKGQSFSNGVKMVFRMIKLLFKKKSQNKIDKKAYKFKNNKNKV